MARRSTPQVFKNAWIECTLYPELPCQEVEILCSQCKAVIFALPYMRYLGWRRRLSTMTRFILPHPIQYAVDDHLAMASGRCLHDAWWFWQSSALTGILSNPATPLAELHKIWDDCARFPWIRQQIEALPQWVAAVSDEKTTEQPKGEIQ